MSQASPDSILDRPATGLMGFAPPHRHKRSLRDPSLVARAHTRARRLAESITSGGRLNKGVRAPLTANSGHLTMFGRASEKSRDLPLDHEDVNVRSYVPVAPNPSVLSGYNQDGCRIASSRNAPEHVKHCLTRMQAWW
jgi:hypothetical protein